MKTELLAWLINATVATSMASIAVLALRRILQRWLGAEIAYRLWMVVPLAAIVAVFSPPQFAPAPTAVVGTNFAVVPVMQGFAQRTWVASNADLWLLGAWAIGLFALVALLVWQQRRYVARMHLRPRADGSWRSGSVGAAPALLGLLRPRLVLPEAFEFDYSDDEQRLVIAHERMHQQRRDPWALAVCAALRVLFWFNPLVHFAAGCFRRDMEFACDAAVLRRYPDKRRLYAAALLKTQLAGQALPIGCLWHHMPPMKERLMLLKQGLPTRHARIAGAVLVGIATLGTTGIALAGHDSALSTASALAAAPLPSSQSTLFYRSSLHMQRLQSRGRLVDKQVMNEIIITRAGEAALVKVDENGAIWGLRFHVDPKPGSSGVTLTGDVFTDSEQHMIGHAQIAETTGTPLVIAMTDKDGTTYRIEARIAIAQPMPPRAGRNVPSTEAHASATAGSGEQREIEIVRNGTPGGDDQSEGDDMQEELQPGDTPEPGARIEVSREITTRPPGRAANDKSKTVRTERRIVMTRNADGSTPPPPPIPPDVMAPLPPPPPPTPMAMGTPAPPPLPALAPLPPTPDAMQPPLPPMPPPRDGMDNAEGLVELRVLVGIDGHAKQVTVVKSQPAGMFDRQAIAAAWQWHFDPSIHNGKPTEGWVTLPMHFLMRTDTRVIQR